MCIISVLFVIKINFHRFTYYYSCHSCHSCILVFSWIFGGLVEYFGFQLFFKKTMTTMTTMTNMTKKININIYI